MKNLILLFPIIFFFFSCKKKNIDSNVIDNQVEICLALVDYDEDLVVEELDQLVADLTPNPTSNDPIGQEENLQTLINRLDNISCITASFGCYACLESFPPLSAIDLEVKNNGESLVRTLYIVTSETEKLSYSSLH